MKKVAIVGANELTRDKAPFDDKTYEIWSISDWICSAWLRRCDLLLEIHQPFQYMNHPRTPNYWEVLQTLEIPVYMYPVADPRVPSSVLYPMDSVLALLDKGKIHSITDKGVKSESAFRPLNHSVAFLMALAILKGYDVIDVYGVELAHSSEYMSQQPMFAFWNGVALGRGLTLNVNCSNGLFNQPLYGIEDTSEKARIFGMIGAVDKQKVQAQKVLDMAEGARQALLQLVNTRAVYKK